MNEEIPKHLIHCNTQNIFVAGIEVEADRQKVRIYKLPWARVIKVMFNSATSPVLVMTDAGKNVFINLLLSI